MNKTKILKDFAEFISIQSVSTDKARSQEIQKVVEFLQKKLGKLGFETQIYRKNQSPPLIVAKKVVTGAKKTIGVYAHYDVQPEDPVDEWLTPPFELTLRNGRFYGRGVADDKGHIMQNIAAVEQLISDKKLNSNIVFIFEGEEESGSEIFEEGVTEMRKIIDKVDVFVVTDMGMFAKNYPAIYFGLRGLLYFDLTIDSGLRDLHSGVYGNAVYNPAHILVELMGKMKDGTTNRVKIPGFYDDVRQVSKQEREVFDLVKRTKKELCTEAQVYDTVSLDKRQPWISTKVYPSLDINGIVSGYTGAGAKTIIPHKASAKFSCRLVEYQEPQKIIHKIKTFIADHLPGGIRYKLEVHKPATPFFTSISNEFIQKTARQLEEVFGNKTVFNRSGGSIPAVEVLTRIFQKPSILTGFTLPDDNIHSPNENIDEDMFWLGIEALQKIYTNL